MDIHRNYLPQALQMLRNLHAWLDKAETHAKGMGYDVNVLLSARLAPDQYPLVKQVQIACDTAKLTAARLSMQEAPKYQDNEKTLAELRTRIDATLTFLESLSSADFVGADTRVIPLPFASGQGAIGENYVNEFALPNLYFHVTTAYQLLRHNGVPVGKIDFIGRVTMQAL